MTSPRPDRALRHALFAVTVAHGVDLQPCDDGVVLPGRPDVLVGWQHCHAALGHLPASSPVAPEVLARWLRVRRWVADTPDLLLADAARVAGLPLDHEVHPGRAWVVERVRGGALDLGLALRGLDPADRERLVLVPPSVWEAADTDPLGWWRGARARLEEMGRLAAVRLGRDPEAPLRPMGDADAVTLLGAATFRAALAAREGGMAAVAVPMRRRGWLRLSLLDPAFAPAAAAATEAADRGFPRPLLVTADEVALAGEGRWTTDAVLDGRLPVNDAARAGRHL